MVLPESIDGKNLAARPFTFPAFLSTGLCFVYGDLRSPYLKVARYRQALNVGFVGGVIVYIRMGIKPNADHSVGA